MKTELWLGTSRKPEYSLQANHIHEIIQIYGIPCKWLFSKRVNTDVTFKDFSHFKIDEESADVKLLPEDATNFENDISFNGFGIFQQQNTTLFISRYDINRLFGDDENKISKIQNSLIITPSSTILEITNVDQNPEGVSNLWSFGDNPNSYKLTTKIYDTNISDEIKIKDKILLKEEEIFEAEEEISTDDIDNFFGELEISKDEQSKNESRAGGVFGNLG